MLQDADKESIEIRKEITYYSSTIGDRNRLARHKNYEISFDEWQQKLE